MDWIVSLVQSGSVASAMLILSLVAALGLTIGSIRVGEIRLGTAGVLFAGLLFGHFGFTISHEVLDFIKEFGLILFVYCIGVQVGPGFISAFRQQGIRLNALALTIVALGVLVTIGVHGWANIPMEVAVGLFSGATTNTPSLAAASQALQNVIHASPETLKMPGLGYAIAYPFGIVGIIASMLLVRSLFRIKPESEGAAYIEEQQSKQAKLSRLNIVVENPNLAGIPIGQIPMIQELGVVVSRIQRAHGDGASFPQLATEETVLHLNDVIHVVGAKDKLDQFQMIVGQETETDLKHQPSRLIAKRVVVTRRNVVGKTLEELGLREHHHVQITRLTRSDIQFTTHSESMALQMGDILQVVGEKENLKTVSDILGDSIQELNFPQVLPIFLGIALGVVLGSWPLDVPGIPASVRLGLAGGPLLVAMVLSQVGNIKSLIWYMHPSSNYILREVGIVLFLACVGLNGGDQFIETLIHGDGLQWMVWAALITVIPLLAVGVYARWVMNLNFTVICGLLAGSMTDPPALAFANTTIKSDAPALSYATVYPLVMISRIIAAQLLVMFYM